MVRAWVALLLLAGCGRPDGGAAPRPDDRTDPALLAALDDPILVDPTLGQYSNRTAVRSSEAPVPSLYPVGGRVPDAAGCGGALQRGAEWAQRLPAALPVLGGATQLEAAGQAAEGCSVAVASFAVAQRPAAVIQWYFARAVADGFSATQLARGRDQVLFGAKGATSYVLVVSASEGGAEVGLAVRTGG
jgi:hypothetical protein